MPELERIERKFSSRLHSLRKERGKGWTLEKVSRELENQLSDNGKKRKISIATLSNWEKGASNPPLELVPMIADYYDISLNYLLGVTDSRTTSLSPLSPDVIRVVELMNKRNLVGQEKIRNTVENEIREDEPCPLKEIEDIEAEIEIIDKRLGNKQYPAAFSGEELTVTVPYKIHLLVKKANKRAALAMPLHARVDLTEAERLSNELKDIKPRINSLTQIFNVRWLLGDIGGAGRIVSEVTTLVERLDEPDDRNLRAKSSYIQGIHALMTGEIRKAESKYREALFEAEISRNRDAVNLCLSGIMTAESLLGKLEDALETASKRFETDSIQECVFQRNLYEVYLYLGQFEHARNAIEMMCSLAGKINDSWRLKIVYPALRAELDLCKGDDDAALARFDNANLASLEESNEDDRFMFLGIMGNIYRESRRGSTEDAFKTHYKALDLSEDRMNPLVRIELLLDLTLDLVEMAEPDEEDGFNKYLKEAQRISKRMSQPIPLLEIKFELVRSRLAECAKKTRKSRAHIRNAVEKVRSFSDAIRNDEFRHSFLKGSPVVISIEKQLSRLDMGSHTLYEPVQELPEV